MACMHLALDEAVSDATLKAQSAQVIRNASPAMPACMWTASCKKLGVFAAMVRGRRFYDALVHALLLQDRSK